jgi:putative peptidoglycan lipid II flippase
MAVVQVPSLFKVGVRYVPRIDLSHPALRKMGRKMVPIFAYVGTNMVALSFRNAYAFEVSPKGPAALQYAWMFYQLPYGIFAVSLATALFPELSSAADRADWTAYKEHFNRGLRTTGLLIMPFAALLVALSEPVITLYRAGDFGADDVPLVAGVLTWWAVGLFSFAAYMFVLRSFYAIQDTRTPMLTNVGASGLRILLYATLTVGLAGFSGWGLRGIPVADAVVFSVHFLWLAWILRGRIGGMDARATVIDVLKVAIASVAGGAAAWLVARLTPFVLDVPGGFLVQLVVAGGVGLLVTYRLAVLLRVPEVADAVRLIRKALARLRPGTPGPPAAGGDET